MTGKRFGFLVVVRYTPVKGAGNAMWLCRCDCGNKKVLAGTSMRCGGVISCGCVKRGPKSGHGHTANGKMSPEYRCWSGVVQRCTNPKSRAFKDYGGRGITICRRWLKFDNFLIDMGSRPIVKNTLERIDNNKGYRKSNCCWATRQEQMWNIRTNRTFEYEGQTKCVGEWAKIVGISPGTLHSRVFAKGWPPKRAMTTPVKKQEHLLTFQGRTQRMTEWADELGMSRKALEHRIYRGWSVEKALTTPVKVRP